MIKFLFVSFLIFLFLRMVAPTLLRWALTYLIGKQMRKAGSAPFTQQGQSGYQQSAAGSQSSRPGRGNVRVDYVPDEKPRKTFTGGEYVEYEEIK